MKLKRFFRTHLVIVLLCAMVISFGLPRDAKAADCFYKGYVVQVVQFGPSAVFFLREKPIDAGMFIVGIPAAVLNTAPGLGMLNTLRSAYQNNTQVGIQTTTPAATCPTPNLSIPGWYPVGDLIGMWPPPLIP
jgi:predicted ATPase